MAQHAAREERAKLLRIKEQPGRKAANGDDGNSSE